MKKINLISIIQKKFPLIKEKISKDSNLIDEHILDSLELMELITFLSENFNFNAKSYLKNKKKFILNDFKNFIIKKK